MSQCLIISLSLFIYIYIVVSPDSPISTRFNECIWVLPQQKKKEKREEESLLHKKDAKPEFPFRSFWCILALRVGKSSSKKYLFYIIFSAFCHTLTYTGVFWHMFLLIAWENRCMTLLHPCSYYVKSEE